MMSIGDVWLATQIPPPRARFSLSVHACTHVITETTSAYRQTPFNGLFSRTTCVIRQQKGKTILHYNEARDGGWQRHQLDHMQIICISFHTDNHASTSSLNFLQTECSSWCPTNGVKALQALQFTVFVRTTFSRELFHVRPGHWNRTCGGYLV